LERQLKAAAEGFDEIVEDIDNTLADIKLLERHGQGAGARDKGEKEFSDQYLKDTVGQCWTDKIKKFEVTSVWYADCGIPWQQHGAWSLSTRIFFPCLHLHRWEGGHLGHFQDFGKAMLWHRREFLLLQR